MARQYRFGVMRRLVNKLATAQVRRARRPGANQLLTTTGRKSGQPRTTPVTLVEADGRRWLVAPYGAVGWVHNLRATGRATLTRGERVEEITVREIAADEAAPVLKRYLRSNSVVRPFFDVRPESSLDEFAAEAHRHPVFLIAPGA